MNETINQIQTLVKEEVKSIKLFHKGYASLVYKIKTKEETLLAKKFIQRKNIKYQKRWSLSTAMDNEVSAIKRLNEANRNQIITPEIRGIDKKNKLFIQTFIPSKKFYRSIIISQITHSNVEQEIYQLGKLISKMHTQNFNKKTRKTIIHADLSSHNIRFSYGKLFLFDPQGFEGDPYEDVSKMMINFYLINPLIKMCISTKKINKCKKAFIEGYEKQSNQKINRKKLIKKIKETLRHERNLKENKLINKIKQRIMNHQNNKIMKKIQNGRL